MISLVVVSHSRALGRAALTLAQEMLPEGGGPVLEVAAGLDEETSGTSATAIAGAITRAGEGPDVDGVLVLMDLGSAVLSAEMALELVEPDLAARVRLSPAPLVEGLVAAVVTAGTGADLDTCAREAGRGLAAKAEQLAAHSGPGAGGEPADESADEGRAGGGARAGDGAQARDARGGEVGAGRGGPVRSVELSVLGEHGLHARPAARLVSTVAEAEPGTSVRLSNVTSGRGPVDALSLSAVATLDAQQGHVLLAEASGPGARAVLDALEELARTAFGDLPGPAEPLAEPELPVPPAVSTEPGVAGSGLEAAIGPAILVNGAPQPDDLVAADPAAEEQVLDDAVTETRARLTELEERARRHLGTGQAEVFAAHAILLHDPELLGDARARIRAGDPAALAWQRAVQQVAERFADLPDSYQRERAQDVRALGDRVLRVLLGAEEPEALGEGVLVVDELDPALAISLDADSVRGVVTRQGGGLGHGVLIAQARGVPVLTGMGPVADVRDGTVLAFDVRTRRLEVDPPPEVQAAFEAMLGRRRADRRRALADTHLPVVTRDGLRVTVKANVSSHAVARLGAGLGAEGSGLVRTEAVFAQWHRAPSVEEQVEVYDAIARAYEPHPVTIRTWDVGGDKPLRFIHSEPEANPFLGVRGVRAFREDPTALLEQLEAIVRVARDHRVNVLFPMITSVEDVDWARARLREAAARSGLRGVPPRLGVGIMVEVPAVAVRLGRVARGLDFISIGSNDLSQYALAAERGNPRVAAWSDPLDPAVLQLIRYICDRAPQGVVVSLCGEMAADPDVAGLLVGLGVRELSATASSVPMVKARLRAASLAELRDLAAGALAARDATGVRELLH